VQKCICIFVFRWSKTEAGKSRPGLALLRLANHTSFILMSNKGRLLQRL
jgi:hypothetical protein